jgi:hypothetical protein
VAISTRVGPDTFFPEAGIHGGTVIFPAAGAGGNVSGTGTYTALDRAAGATTSGTVTVSSGHYTGSSMDNVHFTFTGLSYPPSSIVISGSIDLVWVAVGSPTEYTMTFNVTATSGGNVIAVLDNFTVDSTIAAGQESLTFTGKYTDAAQGYVNVSTTTPMVFNLPGGPASGQVVAQGAGTNKATMTFSGPPTTATVAITP